MPQQEPLSVSRVVEVAKACVGTMPTFVVVGEVTGFRGPNARSGHCYFQVKDDSAAMDCIVWRGTYASSGVSLVDGLEVQLTGKFDVYQASGKLSFIAKGLEVAGEGLLRRQVDELARKLEREGLMAPEAKRPIPAFCERVAVVTSLSGSVIDDVKRTLRRRNPLVELLVAGASVQGPGAPESIERALVVASSAKPDAILLVRGGGSYEDLMTFNDEGLARAVAACPVPVVTGIGHEPDNSICDMVSDRRCSTPTAAAESVAPTVDEVETTIAERGSRLARAMSYGIGEASHGLDALETSMGRSVDGRLSRERLLVESLAAHRCLTDPSAQIDDRANALRQSEQRLHDAIPRSLEAKRRDLARDADRLSSVASRLLRPYESELAKQAGTLDALSPLRVLSRGYSIARDEEGHVITRVSGASVGESMDVAVSDGSIHATITGVSPRTA